MAANTKTTSSQSSEINANPFLSGLAFENGAHFDVWNSKNLTYDLNTSGNPPGESQGDWTYGLSKAVRNAVKDIQAVSGLKLSEVNSSNADVEFWAYDDGGSEFGFSYGIGGAGVFINMDETVSSPTKFNYGGYDYITVIHEFLHNLGLAHPHDSYDEFPGVSSPFGDLGSSKLNQNVYTVMSYNDAGSGNNGLINSSGQQTTGWSGVDYGYSVMGAFDIAMLQTLYGANMNKAKGNNVYVLPDKNKVGTYYKAIWDADGNDTIVYNGSKNAAINLRSATLDLADGEAAGGMLSQAAGIFGGFTIAHGVVIENATGGAGNDRIFGNSADNLLVGNRGQDKIFGKSGNDHLEGGESADKLWGGSGRDNLKGNASRDKLWGESGSDVLKGGSANDVLTGGSGNDVLGGGSDNDILKGGSDNDVLSGGSGNDVLEGESGNDVLSGGSGKDVLKGGSGKDTLIGSRGDDKLTGGADSDKFVFSKNGGNDRVTDFTDGEDILVLRAFNFAGVNSALSKFTNLGDDDLVFEHKGTRIVLNDIRLSELDANDIGI